MENNNKFIYILLLLLYVLVWRWPSKVTEVKTETKDSATAVVVIKDNHPELAKPEIKPIVAVANDYGYNYREIFKFHLGIKEQPMGSNSGPGVDSLLRYCNLPPKNQWCAAACSKMMGLANVPNPKSGWTPSVAPKSKAIYKAGDSWPLFIKKYGPLIPDMVLTGSIYVAEKKRDGHSFGVIYIVDDYVYTYEGNVSDMMLAKKRHYSTISKICNWTPHESTY